MTKQGKREHLTMRELDSALERDCTRADFCVSLPILEKHLFVFNFVFLLVSEILFTVPYFGCVFYWFFRVFDVVPH